MKQETTGDRIKKERLRLGMSQQDVADLAGINKMTISSLERGRTVNPSAENVKPIAIAIRVNPEWLTTGEGDKHQRSPTQTRIKSALKDADITVMDLVEACGGRLAPETVELWLCGTQEPTDAEIDIIAAQLSRSTDWLKSGMMVVQEGVSDHIAYDIHGERLQEAKNPREKAVLESFRKLTREQQDAYQTILDAVDQSKVARGK